MRLENSNSLQAKMRSKYASLMWPLFLIGCLYSSDKYMAKLVVKSKHQIDTCQSEIDIVCAQATDVFLDSIMNMICRAYVLV